MTITTHKVVLRDWHNAICRVAMVTDEQMHTLGHLDELLHNSNSEVPEEQWDDLYNALMEQLGEVEFTNENHRYTTYEKWYDGYFGF